MKYFTANRNNPKPFYANLSTIVLTRPVYYSAKVRYGGNEYSIQRAQDVEDHLVHYPDAKCVISFQIYRDKDSGLVECIAIPRLHFSLTPPSNGSEVDE